MTIKFAGRVMIGQRRKKDAIKRLKRGGKGYKRTDNPGEQTVFVRRPRPISIRWGGRGLGYLGVLIYA